ncbi:Retroelement pol polyprotein-like [Rhynchospora pubera]|uniref:Retroelement pol polyprotein-like n=1 Tax=Rhynchospora pubera TaxID=906938 RepID=A0AAV8BU48_9POAL|nr:Retroelement pol polyprotein-like [Rhynchospora pubera]
MGDTDDEVKIEKTVTATKPIDSSSPFYFSPSDNPGMSITSCILKGENYDLWVKAMRNSLRAKNKLGFVDGTINKLKLTDSQVAVWDSSNSMLVSWLFNSIDSSLQPSVAYFETAKELWDDLKERFSVGNAPRIYQLKSDIAGAKQQGQSVVTYYTRLKSMWDELGSYLRIPACTCGGCVCNLTVDFLRDKEEEKIHQFLMGLDDVYDTIRTTILSMDPLPSLNKVYSTVIQEERHKSVVRGREEHSEAVGFAVHVRKGEKPTCTHCGKVGHEISQCFEIVGYPEGWGRGRRGGRGGRGTGRGRGRGRAQANAMQGDNSAAHDVSGPGTQPKITGLHFEDADWCGSRRCVFIGYPFGKKGWRALDLETNNFVISRDIVFVENEFPFVKTYEDNGKSGCDLDKRSFGDVLNVHESDLTVQNDAIGDEGSELQARGSDQSGHKCQNSDTSVDCAPEMNPQETEPNDSYVTDATTMTQEVTRDLMPRTRQPPAKLRDYICYTAQVDHSHAHPTSTGSSGTPYSISHYVNCNNFSMAHRVFLNAVTKEKEPEYFGEAMKNKNWQEAMKAEIKALEANGTWTVEELPQGKTPIGCKWVYRIKYHSDGTIERYKARLVALGNRQVEGIDYTETFSPVAKMGTIRTVLAVAIAKGWELHQMDVHNAFLHGELHEEVYMRLPPGFTSSLSGKVCRLKKSLYGLRQAPRMWFSKLTTALQKYGFTQSRADYSLFVCAKGTTFLTVLVYVDDLIVAGNDCEAIKKFKQYLSGTFHMKDLGLLKYFLGIEMARGSTGLFLSQRKYTLDILAECGLLGAKPAQTPIEQNHNLSKATGVVMLDPEKYRRLIGRLIYLTFTRPELCYAVHVLAQFMQAPLQTHYDAALRVVRYLKGHPGQGILLRTDSDLKLYGYCDSDWASCPITRRSLTGYFVKLGNSPISWRTKKQPTVSRSSAEAEYRSMATLTCELTWLKSVLSFLGVSQVQPTQLFCDSQAALHIAANPVFHERTKHIEVDCHFVRDQIRDGRISTAHVSSSEQLADLFTKALGKKQFDYLTSKLGICDLHAPT